MAFDVIPTSLEELLNINISDISELSNLYCYIADKFKINDPFAFDIKSKKVKIIRSLQNDLNLNEFKTKKFKLEFGNGSRDNYGINNRGLMFEKDFCQELNVYISNKNTYSDSNKELKYIDAILKIEKLVPSGYEIKKSTHVGELNNRRSLTIDKTVYVGSDDFNIGKVVSDITIECENKNNEIINLYLSLKFGDTVTFMNSGITKYLNKKEIKLTEIKNEKGKKLLSLFNIEHDKFCKIFNEYDDTCNVKRNFKDVVDISNHLKNETFNYFMRSVIGYGYILVHKKGDNVDVLNMTERRMMSFISVNDAKIIYPTCGSNKRIDIVVHMNNIKVKINIRNKNGGIYATHIMADYVMLNKNNIF